MIGKRSKIKRRPRHTKTAEQIESERVKEFYNDGKFIVRVYYDDEIWNYSPTQQLNLICHTLGLKQYKSFFVRGFLDAWNERYERLLREKNFIDATGQTISRGDRM